MRLGQVIQILDVEYQCVTRAENEECNRHCDSCDLVLDSADILEAYDVAIRELHQIAKQRGELF